MVWYVYRYRYTKNKVHTSEVAFMYLKDCIERAKYRLNHDKKVLGGVIEIWEKDDVYSPTKTSFVRYVTKEDLKKRK